MSTPEEPTPTPPTSPPTAPAGCGETPTEVPPVPDTLPLLHLEVEDLLPETTTTLRVSGATPGDTVGFWQGGVGGTTCPTSLTQCLDVADAALLGEVVADGDGVATIGWAPASEGDYPMFQAAVQGTGVHSQGVRRGVFLEPHGPPPGWTDGLGPVRILPPGDYFELVDPLSAEFHVPGGAHVEVQVDTEIDFDGSIYVYVTDPLALVGYGPSYTYTFDTRDASDLIVELSPDYFYDPLGHFSLHVAMTLPAAPHAFSADADGDGYGCEQVLEWLAPAGYVYRGGDCNEADPRIHPEATDLCEDGVDQDCTGTDRSCHPLLGGNQDIELVAYAELGSFQYTEQMASAGDRDHDGLSDVVVSMYGTASVWSGTVWGEQPATTLELTGSSNGEVANPGDVDGDGYDDLVVVGDALRGNAVHVVTQALAGTHAAEDVALMTITGTDLSQVGTLGDASGDGVPDLLIASPPFGQVYAFDVSPGSLNVSSADAIVNGRGLGVDVTGADVDDDGVADLVASSDPGSVWVVPGPLSGTLEAADAGVAIAGAYPFYAEVDVGDVDGDGHVDLAAQIDRDGIGIGVALGPLLAGGDLSDVVIVDAYTGAVPGDLDGDGAAELAVGNYLADPVGYQGLCGVFREVRPGVHQLEDADAVWSGYRAGYSMAGIGDVDGDGHPDLAVGGYEAVWLIHGGAF